MGQKLADSESYFPVLCEFDVVPRLKISMFSLLADLKAKVESFWEFVRQMQVMNSYPTSLIVNADQTPLFLEMPHECTLEMKGARTVHVRTAGYEKERLTVMLAVTASGLKLPPASEEEERLWRERRWEAMTEAAEARAQERLTQRLPKQGRRTTGVNGSAAIDERQEQRTHWRLVQQAHWLPKQGRRTTGAAGDKTATFTQPPPTAPLPTHKPPAPTHPPPSAAATAVGDGGGGGAGDATHPPPPPHPPPPNPKTG
ncbi:unnamed protein product [Closterium sp. NIES-54]